MNKRGSWQIAMEDSAQVAQLVCRYTYTCTPLRHRAAAVDPSIFIAAMRMDARAWRDQGK
jgi:hypothetical protein